MLAVCFGHFTPIESGCKWQMGWDERHGTNGVCPGTEELGRRNAHSQRRDDLTDVFARSPFHRFGVRLNKKPEVFSSLTRGTYIPASASSAC